MFNKGDKVRLKVDVQGRRYSGRISKIDKDNNVTVDLPNGYYVIYPADKWELYDALEDKTQTEEQDEM